MTSNINPSSWASWNLRAKDQNFDLQMQLLLNQLSQFGVQTQNSLSNPSILGGTLNGSSDLFNSSLLFESVDLGVITGSQSVSCFNACGVTVSLSTATAASVTLNLTGLALGVPVTIEFTNSTGGALNLFVAATQPGGTAYTAVLWKTSAAFTNMTATGLSVSPGTVIAVGSASPSGSWKLYMVAN